MVIERATAHETADDDRRADIFGMRGPYLNVPTGLASQPRRERGAAAGASGCQWHKHEDKKGTVHGLVFRLAFADFSFQEEGAGRRDDSARLQPSDDLDATTAARAGGYRDRLKALCLLHEDHVASIE